MYYSVLKNLDYWSQVVESILGLSWDVLCTNMDYSVVEDTGS